MTVLRVWAPKAHGVALEARGQRTAMEPSDGGWWTAPVTLPADTDYRFVLDDGPPLPDPRSPRQPEGVHGPSRTVDHDAFPWEHPTFRAPPLTSALLYELHVGTFTPEGTFDAAIHRLPHLRDLGVTHVELMPVHTYPGDRGWGYDGTALYAPHEPTGGPEGLKRLVDACHGHGLAVILDVVYNHLGPDGNYLGRFGPYFTDRYRTPWGDAVNLDGAGSHEVRRFFCDNARMWLRDYRVDGLRIDAVHAFFDRTAEPFLERLAREVHDLSSTLARPLVIIAESDLNDPRVVTSRDAGGMGCDAQWNDDFHHAVHAALTGERDGYYADFGRLRHVKKALEQTFVLDGGYSVHRGRPHGRSPLGLPKGRFLGYVQTHDQVGNRAHGDRLGHLVSPGRVKVAAALALTGPFVPMLFMGEEWNASSPFQYFTDHRAEGLGDAVRQGRQREFSAFGWDPEKVPDPQALTTFSRSRLPWHEMDQPAHRQILEWYRNLIRLRQHRPDLRSDEVSVQVDEGAGWLRVDRPCTTVACNVGDGERRVPMPREGTWRVLLVSDADARLDAGHAVLPPDSVLVAG